MSANSVVLIPIAEAVSGVLALIDSDACYLPVPNCRLLEVQRIACQRAIVTFAYVAIANIDW
jgi:hypothetical protein